jgi:hypothetical protein
MAADVKTILRTWEDLKAIRYLREGEWQDIADYFLPRKGFQITPQPMELVRRRVTASVGPRALSKSAALFFGYLIDPSRPFIGPNVDRGMIQAGRSTGLSAKSIDYLDTLQWAMFDRMMLPQSKFISSTANVSVELLGFGTGVEWTGRKRGFGPKYQHRPLRSCWLAENADGDVDTLYFRFHLPAWRVAERYPEADKNDQLRLMAADDHRCHDQVQLLHAVEARRGGRRGAYGNQKPFTSCTVAVDQKEILQEDGYDTFPYAVPRLNVEEGSAYGTGLAWHALPNVKVINALQQGTELAVALRNNPPLMKPARMFGKPLDRRPGALNSYDQSGLGFQSAKEAIQRLDIAGDAPIGIQWMELLAKEVDEIFYVDWMRPNDGVQKTAEEIRDTRDLRVRAMTALVPAVDRDLLGAIADRTLEAMIAENQLPPPPAELSGRQVDWDYKGPLAMLQLRGQAEAIEKLFAVTTQAIAFDPHAGLALMVTEGLRAVAEALGVPLGVMRSRAEEAAMRLAAVTQAQDASDIDNVAKGAGALQAAGQGVASLAGAAQPQPQELEAA